MSDGSNILILGGGVSGVTTGIVLELLGFRTRIITEHYLTDGIIAEPRFASLYAAASIVPHTVEVDQVTWHIRNSVSVFTLLESVREAGLRTQRHYEIYEEQKAPEPYVQEMKDWSVLPTDGQGEPGAPRRNGHQPVYGWSFDCLFAEMPSYVRFLDQTYRGLGGEVSTAAVVTSEGLRSFREPVVINCCGAWSPQLFDDPNRGTLVRGHLVKVLAPQVPVHRVTGRRFSYNYTPSPDVYCDAKRKSADVYFYPRSDGWLLGGSRQEGRLEAGNKWKGEETIGPMVEVAGVPVPEPILTLNQQLICQLTGIDPLSFPMEAMIGYRFKRAPIRLDSEELDGRMVVHNYGHGGAGITLSWTCAIVVAKQICEKLATCLEARRPDLKGWLKDLQILLERLIEDSP